MSKQFVRLQASDNTTIVLNLSAVAWMEITRPRRGPIAAGVTVYYPAVDQRGGVMRQEIAGTAAEQLIAAVDQLASAGTAVELAERDGAAPLPAGYDLAGAHP